MEVSKENDRENVVLNNGIYKEITEELPIQLIRRRLEQRYSEVETIFLLKNYCMNCKTDENQRFALEFLSMNGFQQEFVQMIEQNKRSFNPLNRDWADVYEILQKYKEGSISPDQMLEIASSITTNDPTLQFLLLLIDIYGQIKLFNFNGLWIKFEQTNGLFHKIEDIFMLDYLEMRKEEVLFLYYWKRNEIVMARKYGFKIINNSLNVSKRCDLLMYLAQTYIFEDYKKSISFLLQAKKMADMYQLQWQSNLIEKHNIPFVSAIFKHAEGVETDDIEEKAHLLIAKGQIDKAITMLEGFGSLTPFRAYYLGKAKADTGLLKQSYEMFIHDRSDYFFARLPIYELAKLQ